MPLFHDIASAIKKKKGITPKSNPLAKYKRASDTRYFKIKKNNKPKSVQAPHIGLLALFSWMLGVHSRADKRASKKNADPQTIAEHKAVAEYASALKGPAKYLGNKELTQFHRMGLRYQTVQKIADKRLKFSIASIMIPLIWSVIKMSSLSVVAIFVAPIITWEVMSLTTSISYNNWATHQQSMFDVIMTIIAPYLYGMNQVNAKAQGGSNGTAIESILNTVAHRIDNHGARDAVATLAIDIRYNQKSFKPYAVFARKFSTTPTAYMFMHSVFNLAQGSSDISAIRELVSDIMHDLMTQVRKIEKHKLHRFVKPPIIMFLDWFYIIMAYFGIYAFKLLTSTLKFATGK